MALRTLWSKYPVLGLTAREGVPGAAGYSRPWPAGPRSPIRAINVKLSASHPSGSDWVLIDRFQLKRSELASAPDIPAKDQPRTMSKQNSGVGPARGWRSRRAWRCSVRLVRVSWHAAPASTARSRSGSRSSTTLP